MAFCHYRRPYCGAFQLYFQYFVNPKKELQEPLRVGELEFRHRDNLLFYRNDRVTIKLSGGERYENFLLVCSGGDV